jgi:molybdopterin synthase catalytic subunit
MRILYFAWLRQKTGIDSEEVEMPSHITDVAGLIEWLKERNENFAEALSDFESIRVAVNQEFAEPDAPVAQGDEVGEDALKAMTLEHYPGMTEKMLREIEAEANDRWPLEASLIVHRYGRLEPGDQIVLVATASPHRQAAFDSCAFLIDWLKTKAPFWKLEDTQNEGARWVEAKAADDRAAERWAQTDKDAAE